MLSACLIGQSRKRGAIYVKPSVPTKQNKQKQSLWPDWPDNLRNGHHSARGIVPSDLGFIKSVQDSSKTTHKRA
jgi:hypothetical protein